MKCRKVVVVQAALVLLRKKKEKLLYGKCDEILVEYAWFSYLIAIAVPMYVCATASLPIAAALMLGGVSP
ncbi:MAG: hypothetical protein AUK54_09925 [Helicobacteraceae bacterium CG2_30_36_10]|nr:MAG: hypothetical protein AUK54_09925 [Helicobacteraceae bacterium CG2_30_36_10]